MIKFIAFALSLATICYVVFEAIVRLAGYAEKYFSDSLSFLVIPLISLIAAFVVLKMVDRFEKGEEQKMRNV